MQFSQRYGFKPVKSAIQIDSMDLDLRNSLWNVAALHFFRQDNSELKYRHHLHEIAVGLCLNFFKEPVDTLPSGSHDYIDSIRNWFFNAEWFNVYDFIEFMVAYSGQNSKDYVERVNFCLEREKSGYRFVGEQIASIVDKVEIDEIERALTLPDKFSACREHIRTALQLYSSKSNPNYRNSIKESISSIECLAAIIANEPKSTLGKVLKIIEKKHKLHPSMTQAFDKLYGYTSDSGGIRHAMLEESKIEGFEALFMLVICSAFLNYLISAAEI